MQVQHLAVPVLDCCEHWGGVNLGAQIAKVKSCHSVIMAHKSGQMQILILFFVASFFQTSFPPR